MNRDIERGIANLANVGLDWAQRKYQIEAQTQYESATTKIAGEVDRFNLDLDADPNYDTYAERWAKKQQELQKYTGSLTSPDAKRQVESYLQKVSEQQTTVLQDKIGKAVVKRSYVDRTNALGTRLEQAGVPTQAKLEDIDGTISGMVDQGIIDIVKAQEMRGALASVTIGRDFSRSSIDLFKAVASEYGPEAALQEAEKYILEENKTWAVGGQTIGLTETQKNSAQSDIKDLYNGVVREKKAADEAAFKKSDESMYSAYSRLVAGDNANGLTNRMIDNSGLPPERKIYWRSKITEFEGLASRDLVKFEETKADDLWNRLNIALVEFKRSGNATKGDITVGYGDQQFTFRDALGLQDIVKTNYAIFAKVYGDQWAGKYEAFIKELDKPAGVADATLERIEEPTKNKKNPTPTWQAAEHKMMYESWLKDMGGKVTPEQSDAWFKAVVERPKLERMVKEITENFGTNIVLLGGKDDDDFMTEAMTRGDFRYDIQDGRPFNPLTRDALQAYAVAVEKKYREIEKIPAGQTPYSAMWTSNKDSASFVMTRKDGLRTETISTVLFGSDENTALIKVIKDGTGQRVQAYDEKEKKWKDAIPRKDKPSVYDFAPVSTTRQDGSVIKN